MSKSIESSKSKEDTKRPIDTDARVISVLNQKGGVGKTTTTIHLAGALSNMGYEVLVVDADPTGNLTKMTTFKETYNGENDGEDDITLFEVLTELEHHNKLASLIVHHDEFDLVPAHTRMSKKEIASHLRDGKKSEKRLKFALERANFDKDYDFILIDCAPERNTLTDNCLFVDGLIIPTFPEAMNLEGFDVLDDQLREIETWHDIRVNILGVVLNRHEDDNEVKRITKKIDEVFANVPRFIIRKRVQIKRAIGRGEGSVYSYYEDGEIDWSPGDSYMDIASHMEDRFETTPSKEDTGGDQ